MKTLVVGRKYFVFILITFLMISFGIQDTYAQEEDPVITASTPQPLTEAALHESVVTLTLNGHTWDRSIITIGNALDVSGVPSVTIGRFGPAWLGVKRINDTQITVELGFEGDFDTDSILTVTVGADAIVGYNGPALTAQIPVTASMEQEPPGDGQETPADDPEETGPPPTYDYIQGPWLWMIAPGSDIDADYLAAESEGILTETQVAQNGLNVGDTLGELQWTRESIYPSTHCGFFVCASNNVQHVVNAAGLSRAKNLRHHTAYAFINIVSPRDQNNVKMGVGSDDSVKVWLNGTVVLRKKTRRRTTGIQDRFDTNLKAGNNLLLVKVSEYSGNWGMFFKIYLEPTEYKTSIYMIDESLSNAADVNEDGQVDIHDLILVIKALGETVDTRVDVNNDGNVDKIDLLVIVENLDDAAIPAAPLSRAMLATLEPAILQAWINRLHVEDDGSLISQKALAILKGLLAITPNRETALFANYPNPFNPETWIPYQLSKPTDVRLTIYAVDGQVVRKLALGHQPVGIYHSRSRAAYWDGKNTFGEPVASGVYFYTLTTDDFTATRKMLIRK